MRFVFIGTRLVSGNKEYVRIDAKNRVQAWNKLGPKLSEYSSFTYFCYYTDAHIRAVKKYNDNVERISKINEEK